jgi:hypothetical protein
MTCNTTSEKLMEFVYDELPAAESAAMESHLAKCDSCRREWEELAHNVELLDRAAAAPAIRTAVEPASVLAAARRGEIARAKRWRLVALFATSATILVAIATAAVRRVEVHATHVVICWSESPSAEDLTDDATVKQLRGELARTQTLLAEHRRRLDDLDRLGSLIVAELKEDDLRLARSAAKLHLRIDAVQRQNDERWQAVGRGFHDWYLAQVTGPIDQQTNLSIPATAGDLP